MASPQIFSWLRVTRTCYNHYIDDVLLMHDPAKNNVILSMYVSMRLAIWSSPTTSQRVFRNCSRQREWDRSGITISGIAVPRFFWQTVFPWSRFRNGLVTATSQLRRTFTHIWITARSWLRLMQCSMAWALHRTEKEKPAVGKTDYWRDFWRRRWDSNPRNLAVQLISSQNSLFRNKRN